MSGSIKSEFNGDLIFGFHPERLIFEKLEELILKSDGVIVGENPFGLNGKNLIQMVGFKKRPMNVGGIGWFDGAASVVVGNINIPQKAIGRFESRNSSQPQFFDQPILMSFKAAFNAAFG